MSFGIADLTQRFGRNTSNDLLCRDSLGYNRVGADHAVCSDADALEYADASTNPDIAANLDRCTEVTGIADRDSVQFVIGVAQTGVLADHATVAKSDTFEGDDMHAA